MVRPGTFHAPGLPKEWNAIIDKYVEGRKGRDREEARKKPKRKGGQSKGLRNSDSRSRYKEAKNDHTGT
jgi:hypothetical protein